MGWKKEKGKDSQIKIGGKGRKETRKPHSQKKHRDGRAKR
jgi:hypothetical protein